MQQRHKFTEIESRIINMNRTPKAVQYFTSKELYYNNETDGKTLHSFRRVLGDKKAHCLESALTAAAILKQHGYPPLIVCMESTNEDHNIFVYKRKKGWGAVDGTFAPNQSALKPKHRTIWDLIKVYHHHYHEDSEGDSTLRGYALVNLDIFKQDWITNNNNLWFIERHLWKIPYRMLFPRKRKVFYIARKDGSIRILKNGKQRK